MPLTHELAHKRYKVGQEPKTVHTKSYNFTVAELSKDIVRELARDARMVNYSQRSKQEMLDFLNEQEDLPLRNVQLKVFRATP
jgi:hypothetical protein